MNKVNKAWDFFSDLMGFRRNSKYVRTYLNDANIKSSIYMSFIIIVLEIWMIIRQLNEYIVPNWSTPEKYGYASSTALFFGMTSLYYLFIMCSVAMMVFGIIHLRKKESDNLFIANIILGSLCVLWPLMLILENQVGNIKGTNVNIITLFLLYFSMPLFGASIIGNSLYRRIKDKNNTALSIAVIICFALVCLLFGIKVGYSDYISSSKPKMITTFLSMIIFVACLLIWKPYISIVMLTSIFIAFLFMLKNYNPGNNDVSKRIWLEGDEINYITFLISLTVITISIYQQRVTEAKKDEKLIHDAIYDHLVEIHNTRFLIDKIVTNEFINPVFSKDKIYLFINLYNFRIVNDQRGFDKGDLFIMKVARIIIKIFGPEFSSRQSDDHFVVFTETLGLEGKIEALNKSLADISEGLFIRLKVGGYRPKPNDNPARSIDKARYACGMIKKKSEVIFLEYDDKMDEKVRKRQYIVNHIDEAIAKGWICAYYQPVVWSKSNSLCGAEALCRWIDPNYGFLSPADFIPVLEEARLIHKLDSGVIRFVCSNMRRAIDEGRPVVPISINFSRLDFELMDVVSELEKNVKEYKIDRNYIHVEITESALADNLDKIKATVGELQRLGYDIWLDDFGSGYSSLNVIKDFQFDVVKIDMTFLTNFDTNPRTKSIIDCIVQLADRLGMQTLTEGVETKEEAKFLEKIGCGRLQGYLFGKPLKLSDFEEKIQNKEFKIGKLL